MPIGVIARPRGRAPRKDKLEGKVLTVHGAAIQLAVQVAGLDKPNVALEQELINFRNDVIKPAQEQAHAAYGDIITKQREALEITRGKLKALLAPLEDADTRVRGALSTYYQTIERMQREEQRKAEEEQAERQRLAAIEHEKERIRIEAELEKRLAELPPNADDGIVEALVEQLQSHDEVKPVAVQVVVAPPQKSGLAVKVDNWKGELSPEPGALMKVLQQIVKGELPETLVELHEPTANTLAKQYQDKKQFPGLRFHNVPYVRGVSGK